MRSAADDSESGIAYTFIVLIVFLIVAAVVYLAIVQTENAMLEPINDMISQGKVSERTAQAIAFNRGITMGLPIITLIGAFIFSIMAGTRSRDGYGTEPGALMTGWVLLVLFCITGFILSFAGGTIIDRLYTGMDNAGIIQSPDISDEWNAAQMSGFNTYSGFYYFVCAMCPIIGIVVFIKSIVFRTQGSRYYGGGGY